VPLSYQINAPVDVVFWCDHGDIYNANHADRMPWWPCGRT